MCRPVATRNNACMRPGLTPLQDVLQSSAEVHGYPLPLPKSVFKLEPVGAARKLMGTTVKAPQ